MLSMNAFYHAIVYKRYRPAARTYKCHNAWGLFEACGKCLACAGRCSAGAMSPKGHDTFKGKDYTGNVTSVHVAQEQLGFKVNGCGLGQTKVPCEVRNPLAKNMLG